MIEDTTSGSAGCNDVSTALSHDLTPQPPASLKGKAKAQAPEAKVAAATVLTPQPAADAPKVVKAPKAKVVKAPKAKVAKAPKAKIAAAPKAKPVKPPQAPKKRKG